MNEGMDQKEEIADLSESAKTGEDGTADPGAVFTFWRGGDADFYVFDG